MQVSAEQFLERLWDKHQGRRLTVLCGGGFGDNGKGVIESALMPFFEASVRVSGGANTGRTCYLKTPQGTKKVIFHLVPTGWADNKLAIIGDWVLIDLERLVREITEIKNAVGLIQAQLCISKKAPLCLSYHGIIEVWIESIKGQDRVGSTGRGISPTLAGIDLRIGPLVGHLLYPDLLFKMVKGFYQTWEPIFNEMFDRKLIEKKCIKPQDETDRLLAFLPQLKNFITDVDPILHSLAEFNVPILFGLTQGFGLHFKGTYPFSSATQTIASAAAYCGGLPMEYFGPVIQVDKLLPTRVGAGPFPTGLWDRQEAEKFPLDHPELFSDLPGYNPGQREDFLRDMRKLINGGNASSPDLAKYFMVLGNELGASTGRGREIGLPDLHMIKSGAKVNGADCLALTRLDLLAGLNLNLPLGIAYQLAGKRVLAPVIPTPVEKFDRLKVVYKHLPIDLKDVDLAGLNDENSLPPCLGKLVEFFEEKTDTPVGIISTAANSDGGKIFRKI